MYCIGQIKDGTFVSIIYIAYSTQYSILRSNLKYWYIKMYKYVYIDLVLLANYLFTKFILERGDSCTLLTGKSIMGQE